MLQVIRRVLSIRQDIAYSFCFTGAETEIHKIKEDSKMNREKNIDRHGRDKLGQIDRFLTPLLSGCRLPLKGQCHEIFCFLFFS
jgi:hypothetical protein